MLVPELIQRKRDGSSLGPDEWHDLIMRYTAGEVPDYQMSALVMACFLNGIETQELGAITDAMVESGDRLEFPTGLACIDKHSTGGVGDKVSLVLAPLVAAAGVPIPMMSGRGLGHTTGTLDKLEAIPGFKTNLSLAEAKAQVESIGCALIGQTPEIAPADRKLYALRDATATVESIPLISASIMSKKLAEGLSGLVLDVKHGSGAFLPETDRARELAQTMIRLGAERGCRTVALLTAMDRPLGCALGNAIETAEAIGALKGEGPGDLLEVTFALGSEMLILGRVAGSATDARIKLEDTLRSGRALEKFREIIEAQGGDARVLDDPGLLPSAPEHETVKAGRAGTVSAVEPRALGKGIVALGGGRTSVDDVIDPGVGFTVHVRPGDQVAAGDPLATVHARDRAGIELVSGYSRSRLPSRIRARSICCHS